MNHYPARMVVVFECECGATFEGDSEDNALAGLFDHAMAAERTEAERAIRADLDAARPSRAERYRDGGSWH